MLRLRLGRPAAAQRTGSAGGGRKSVGEAADKNPFVFSLSLDFEPGSRWSYSNEGVQLLSPILERAAGEPLEAYARRRLFAPLGMNRTRLRLDGAGNPWTYADATTTLRDFARPCQLMVNGGRWGGTQIVPETWVELSTSPIPQNPRYGLLWWLMPGGFATRGYLGTDCYAFPGLDLVVARMQRRPQAGAEPRHEGAPTATREPAGGRAPAPRLRIDAETLRDLGIFDPHDGGPALFALLDRTRTAGVRFAYFDAEVQAGQPTYDYRLKVGHSPQRLGMLLLEREGVLECLAALRRAESG